jgi:hypothetical protein
MKGHVTKQWPIKGGANVLIEIVRNQLLFIIMGESSAIICVDEVYVIFPCP